MPRGRILELKNNYGIIDTDAYKVEHEWIPANSARTAHPFQRNGAPFRFKLRKAQQVN